MKCFDYQLARNWFPRLLGLLVLAGVTATLLADVGLGMRESELLDDLGEPAGIIKFGNRKQLTYPQGVITLVDGKVAKIDQPMANWLERRRNGDPNAVSEQTAELKPAVKPPKAASASDRIGIHAGKAAHFVLMTRMYDDPSQYYSGDARQAWKQALSNDRDEPGTPEAAVTYPAGSQSALVYVPNTKPGLVKFGVYVDIRSDDAGGMPAGYDAICDQHAIIWISPDAAGNDVHSARRCALALDALATVKRRYRIDDQRTYVGGFSGGGAVAARLAILYPEFFRAAFIHARGVYLQPVRTADRKVWLSHFPFLTPELIRAVADQHQRVVFFTGPADINYIHVQRTVLQWASLGFSVKEYDVPGLGHQDAPADVLGQAVTWVENGI